MSLADGGEAEAEAWASGPEKQTSSIAYCRG